MVDRNCSAKSTNSRADLGLPKSRKRASWRFHHDIEKNVDVIGQVAKSLGNKRKYLIHQEIIMSNITKSIVTYGLSGLGAGATVGGGVTALVVGGVGAPVGALIGGAIGMTGLALAARYIEAGKQVFTQGEAREYLVNQRNQYPDLPVKYIVAATEFPEQKNVRSIYMFLSDNVIKCTKEDVDKWLKTRPWRRSKTIPHGK